MVPGQDDYTIFQKHENASTGMAWQLVRPQSYRKRVVYHEDSLEEAGLHYKNEADSVCHTHMVSRRQNTKYLLELGVINEKKASFDPRGGVLEHVLGLEDDTT